MVSALLLVIGLALSISFLCSIMEAVLLSVSHSFVEQMRLRDERAGAILTQLREHIDEPIAAILTLNTIAHTVGATVAGALALEALGDKWIALFSAVLTLAVLVFSEIVPKTIGATHWKVLARSVAYALRALIVVMKPVLAPLALLARPLAPRGERKPSISRGEFEILAEIGRREGVIDEKEWQVVRNVVNLDRTKVEEVMTPRTVMVAIPLNAGTELAQTVMLDHGCLRLPVYDGTIDQVVGLLFAEDLWRAAREGEAEIGAVMRPARFVPASKLVGDLLGEMRSDRAKSAIVIDEFGGTAGLVNFEDLLEEIVGSFQDERGTEQLRFEEVGDHEVRIDGLVPISEINERLDLALQSHSHYTLGGYVFERLGRVARVGDEVRVEGGKLRVLAIDRQRVRRAAFIRRPRLTNDSTTHQATSLGGSGPEPSPVL
jgi:CBS domain containing-hemolysin-like protein